MSAANRDRAPASHQELMRAMGTPAGDGFDPMPPRQLRSLMDYREQEHIRILAWIWKHTTGNPGKGRRRSPYARDARGILGLKHMASDLDMMPSNASQALKRLIEQGRARKDEQGRIYLCGDTKDPLLSYVAARQVEDFCTDNSQTGAEYCTDNFHPALAAYFQQVPQNESSQVAADCLEITAFAKKLEADAIKAARDEHERIVKEYLAARGYVPPEEARGRPRKERENPAVQLTLLRVPNLSVQINGYKHDADSVQKPNGYPYKSENASAQISASLLNSSEYSEYSEKDISNRASSSSSTPAATTTNPSSFEVPEPERELRTLAESALPYAQPERELLIELAATCRERDPAATTAEIVHVIHDRGKIILAKRGKYDAIVSPMRWLVTAVPKCFPIARMTPPEPESPPWDTEDKEQRRRELERDLADEAVSEAEKGLIRTLLDEPDPPPLAHGAGKG
ncbi:MAG: hypothetical protein M3Y72_20955 [Acidobacteriota bacterium]|nr:hypothetical protein [Acidobacteriota bacterium]